MSRPFVDRNEAGRALAGLLHDYAGRNDVLVLALPRGGVPVGFEIAQALHVPLDLFLVRKLGVPGHEELAMGALASGHVLVLNEDVIAELQLTHEIIDAVVEAEERELLRRQYAYRDQRPFPHVQGRTVILVDDGVATGATMRAAIQALRQLHPLKIVVAVPVASRETCAELQQEVDELICLLTPEPFRAVGLWYLNFSQTSDDEVRRLLLASARRYAQDRQVGE